MNRFVWNFGDASRISFDFEDLWKTSSGPKWENETWSEMIDSADSGMRARFSRDVGFYDWPVELSQDLLKSINACAGQLRKDFEAVLILGIGGSYLGPYALVEALVHEDTGFPIHWVSNVDPCAMNRAVRFANQHRCACIVISKSGNTVETMSALFHLYPFLEKKGMVAITDPTKGQLRTISEQEGWTSFEIPASIGGRFSVLTAVGLLPAACAGLDVVALCNGAKQMRTWLETFSPEESPAARYALAMWLWDTQHGANIQYLMPYWSCLKSHADWYVQLWGESLGKHPIGAPSMAVGPTPVAALGSTDQHSLLQLFREGPKDKVVGFIDAQMSARDAVIGSPALDTGSLSYLCPHTFSRMTREASLATQRSLAAGGTATYRVDLHELGEATLAAWMFFMETACAYAGEFYHVDAYDQPGVEETKILLKKALT